MKKGCSKQSDTWWQTDTEKNIWNPRLQMDTAGVIHVEDKVKESELIGKVKYILLSITSASKEDMPPLQMCWLI